MGQILGTCKYLSLCNLSSYWQSQLLGLYIYLRCSMNASIRQSTSIGLKDIFEMDNLRSSTVCSKNFSGPGFNWGQTNSDDEMRQIDDKDDITTDSLVKFKSASDSEDLTKITK